MSMEHRVFIPEKLDELYSYKANHPFFWNVHSDMNEGYRATETMWEWVRQNGIEVEDWGMEDHVPEDILKGGGVVFVFKHLPHAVLFKLTWG